MTTRFALSLLKAVLSLAYWTGCMYLATGMFTGDRVDEHQAIVAANPPFPFPLFAIIALLAYAALLAIWDRLTRTGR